MKININKLLSGGLLASVGFVPGPASEDSSKASSSGSKKTDSILSSELLNKIEQEGLQNEVSAFFQALDLFELAAAHGLITAGNLAGLRSEANRILRSLAAYNDAKKRAEKEDALDDYAIDLSGYIYAFDKKGNILRVEFSKFDRKKYQPLSISELLTHREWNPKAAWNTSMINTIASTTSMEKINDFIGTVLSKVKDTENKQEAWTTLLIAIGREAAKGKNITQNEYEGLLALAQLQEQVGSDALLKEVSSIKSPKILLAILYLYSIMPKNMKLHLVGSYVAEGGSYKDAVSHTSSFLINALDMGTSLSYEHKYSYDSSVNGDSSGSSGSSKTNTLGVLELLVQGTLGKIDYLVVGKNNDSKYSIVLHGTGTGSLGTFNNDIVDKIPMSVAMQLALAPIVDQNHITMGDLKIDSGMLDTILYNGGPVINIWAPTDGNGDIDLDALQRFTKVLEFIEHNPQLTTEDKNQLLANNNLLGEFKADGSFEGYGNMAQFLVVTGLTSDEVVDPKSNPYSSIVPKSEKDSTFNLIHRVYGALNNKIKDKDGQYKFETGWFEATTDLVKAPIFMRLSKTAQLDVGTFSGHGAEVSRPTYEQLASYDLLKYNRENTSFITPSTSKL